jgi:membrane protein
VIAIASFFPLQHFTDDVVRLLGQFAPREMIDIIREQMVKIGEAKNGGLLTIGILGALWSSSAAVVSLVGAMNHAYDIDESRPWWKVRLMSIALTIALSIFVVVSFTLIVAGLQLADWLGSHFAFGSAFV